MLCVLPLALQLNVPFAALALYFIIILSHPSNTDSSTPAFQYMKLERAWSRGCNHLQIIFRKKGFVQVTTCTSS